ncbi:MAG: T9SS type A sorting domain-containing protein [Flavobacteriales bacterium]
MRLFAITSFALLTITASAQTAVNSDCAHAIALPVAAGNVQVDFAPVNGAQLPGGTPVPVTACSGSGNRGSAWFSFNATSTTHWIRTEGDGTDQSSMEVLSGTCGSLTTIGCFAPNSATPQVTGLSVGTTYYLRVLTLNPTSCSANDCMVWVAVVSAPVNDECANATELFVNTSAVTVDPATEISTLGATQSQAACTGGAGASNDDVWYRFTATHAAHFFPTVQLSGGNPTVEWFSGACGSLTSIGCNVKEKSGLTVGQEYRIRVHSSSTAPEVTTRALAGVFVPAPNDECSNAVPITVVQDDDPPAPVRLSTTNCTSSTVPCGTIEHDVWLSFVAPSTSVTAVSSALVSAAIFSGTCGSLSCLWNNTSLSPTWTFSGLTIGATYYLKIGSGTVTRNTTLWMFAPPENDECNNAVPLSVSPLSVFGHTFGATQTLPQMCGGTAKDVWYSFVAGAGRHLVECTRTLTPNTQLYTEAYSGTCGALTSIACQQTSAIPMPLDGLVPGTTYYLRVMGANGGFSVAVRQALVNDECEGAIALPYSALADFDAIATVGNANAADGSGSCDAYRDTWFKFTAAHTTAAFIAPGISGPGTGVELLSGACGALTSIDCQVNMNNVRVRYIGLTVGAEYHIRLSSLSNGRCTPMLFDRNTNDGITGALDVPTGGGVFAQPTFEQMNYAASQSYAQLCGSTAYPDEDTWFHFVATAASHTVTAEQRNLHFIEPAISGGFHIEVYDTLSTDSATLDAHVIGCGASPVVLTGLTIGDDYWYRAFTGNTGTAERCAFSTSVNTGSNDEASGALTLNYSTGYTVQFNTSGATQSQPGANCAVSDVADDDIWFKFTSSASPARLVVGYHTADLTLELFSGVPGNLTSIACSDNILVLPALTVGQTYYARLYSWNNATPVQGRLGLLITPSLTANGCVDETCLGPVLLANPSIEQGDNCFAMIPEVDLTAGLGTPVAPGWPRMQAGSSDGYSSCADFDVSEEVPTAGLLGGSKRLLSRSGKGMGGVILKDYGNFDYHEYLQAPLTEALIPGEPYLVSFHAAILTENHVCLNGLGAALTLGPAAHNDYTTILPAPPSILSEEVVCTDQWVNICGIVVPDEAVDHITIGPFLGNGELLFQGQTMSRAYYFIDDVVVARVTDPGCITGLGDVPPISDDASNNANGDNLRIYPNPASDRVTIVCDAGLFGEHGVIEVFDVTGKRVHAEQVASLGALQQLDLFSEWREGLYLLMVRVEGQAPRSARVMLKR